MRRTLTSKPHRLAAAALLSLALAAPPVLGEDSLDGRQVMQCVDARPRGGDQVLSTTWRLRKKSGRERVRKTRSYWRDYRALDGGMRSKRLIVFESPADLRDMGFLVWSYADSEADDTRWIYLPALRKIRRIAGRDRGKSFAGTEFNYEDLDDREIDEEAHSLVELTQLDGRRVYVVDSRPHDTDSGYTRRRQYVDVENCIVPRIEYFNRHDQLERTLTVEWQKVDDIWDWARLEMQNERSGNRTTVEVTEVQHTSGLDDWTFSENALRDGVR
jgi:hypothetical protein